VITTKKEKEEEGNVRKNAHWTGLCFSDWGGREICPSCSDSAVTLTTIAVK
jgi:hypothetical protein